MKAEKVFHPTVWLLPLLVILGLPQAAKAAFTYPNCPDLTAADFKDVILVNQAKDPTLNEPTSMTIAKDGRVFFTERALGNIKMIDLDGSIKLLGNFKVYNGHENGMRYVTVDPDFAANRWIYVLMSPLTPQVNRLARMKLKADWTIDMATVKVILDLPWTYDTGHQGGAIAWDNFGAMYLTAGNNKFNVDNFNVTNESVFMEDNGQGTANTNDFRGKILHIKPLPFPDAETPAPGAGRTYGIPAGNLREFYTAKGLYGAADQAKILPEIYTMGHRNPYTVSFDPYTGYLSWGDVGADAGTAQADRGPAGVDEFNLVRQPGFMGWPYFSGANLPYTKWDYVNGKSLNQTWDVNGAVNTSINNTGVAKLPPAQPAILWESHQKNISPFFLEGGGAASMTGPIYHYDGSNPSTRKLPPHFDGKWLVGDFTKDWVKVATLSADFTKVTDLQSFPGGIPGQYRILNLQIGPDGAFYYLNYAGWGSTSPQTRIGRLEYTGSCRPSTPVPQLPSALGRPSPPYARLSAPDIAGGSYIVPEGYSGAEAFDIAGRLVFRKVLDETGSDRILRTPEAKGKGLLRIRFFR
ncbi:MAG: cytochrome [Fibrobacteres bacterium]|nr:cytochrome [Fibrobacterota bacterium]